LWRFAEHVDKQRLNTILIPTHFQEIVASIVACAATAGNLCCNRPEPGNGTMLHHRRRTFRITVDEAIGDQFFNSPVGYRAAYADDCSTGESANRLLITELLPHLLAAANARPASIDAASLHDESAKVWIWQKKGQFHSSFDPDEPAILVPNWLNHRAEAIEFGIERIKHLPRSEQPPCRKAIWGVRLHGPIREIEVIGAWINERAGTISPPPPDKRERSLDIHRYGFA